MWPSLKVLLAGVVLVAAMGWQAGPAQAEGYSLLNPSAAPAGGRQGLFSDQRAHAVGDLLTIVVVEKFQASQSASTSADKSGSLSLGPGTGILQQLLPGLGASGKGQSDAKGTTQRDGQVMAQITAVVQQVLPNGNLVVEGKQIITLNAEKQELVISGIVRPRDIRPDNTVLSSNVANAQIRFSGEGPVGYRQNMGLLDLLGLLF